MEDEVGSFQETQQPQVKGTLAQKRAEERKQKELEHKKRLAELKKAKGSKPVAKRASGFDKS